MEWRIIDHNDTIKRIIADSEPEGDYSLVFKHSTRCPISAMALHRLERAWINQSNVHPYFLDLIRHRDISNNIAESFGVMHESPQLLLFDKGKVVYHASHNAITFDALKSFMAQYMQIT